MKALLPPAPLLAPPAAAYLSIYLTIYTYIYTCISIYPSVYISFYLAEMGSRARGRAGWRRHCGLEWDGAKRGGGCGERSYLAQSVFRVDLQKSTPTQIREPILNYY